MLCSGGVLRLLTCYCIFKQFHKTFGNNKTVYAIARKGFYFEFIFLFSFQVVLAFLYVYGFLKKSNATKRSHAAREIVGFS